MLTIYLITLLTGGVLVATSALLGDADTDLDLDADLDLDVDLDLDADLAGEPDIEVNGLGDAFGAWLPFASMRFWTFGAAFFGLTGLLLETLSPQSGLPAAGLAAAVGYVCGLGATRIIRTLRRARVDSSVRESDYLGAVGRVLLTIRSINPGKVRLNLKDRTLDLMAETSDSEPLRPGQTVIVFSVEADGRVRVTAEATAHDRDTNPDSSSSAWAGVEEQITRQEVSQCS